MWEISIWFFAFLFAINGFLVWFEDTMNPLGYDEISPFTNSTFSVPAEPSINATLDALHATTATNSTGGAGISIWSIGSFAWNGSIFFINFLVGSLAGSFFLGLGMPAAFLAILYGLEVFFLVVSLVHILRSGNLL